MMLSADRYHRVVSGERGFIHVLLRGCLCLVEPWYSAAVRVRNRHFDRQGPSYTPPVPVISVGNITAGGTGKTPLVIEIVRQLERLGSAPVVVSRGYGQVDGNPNDEELVIRRNCANVVCVADADREAACERACREFGADVIVLDDGFQHRRVGRNCDVVVVDATCPFGYDHVLPRGLLREPVSSLRRANLIVLTRCDQVASGELERVERRIGRVAPAVSVLKCVHRVTSIERLDGSPVDQPLDGKKGVVFAGIGRPSAFLTTVRQLGMEVIDAHWWPDHHAYGRTEVVALAAEARPPYDYLVTTEKDAVKLTALGGLGSLPIVVVRIAIDFLGDGGTMLASELERIVDQSSSS